MSFVRIGVMNCDQCYSVGTTTLFFYDYLLTLKDEVTRVTDILSSARLTSVKGQIRLVWGEILGYAENRPTLRDPLTGG